MDIPSIGTTVRYFDAASEEHPATVTQNDPAQYAPLAVSEGALSLTLMYGAALMEIDVAPYSPTPAPRCWTPL